MVVTYHSLVDFVLSILTASYTGLCHMRTTTTEDPYGRCLYHMHLSLSHVWSKEDCVDQMVVSFEKNSLAYGLMEEIVIQPAKVDSQ